MNTQTRLKVLIVEDLEIDAELALRELAKAGIKYDATRVETKDGFLHQLREFAPDIILSDYSMPHFDGSEALELARELHPDIPFIFVSGTMGEEVAIESLKRGAADYVLKTNLVRLPAAVRRTLQEKLERMARQRAERELWESQERFGLFMRHLPGAAFMKDRAGRYRFINDTWKQITHTTDESKVLGQSDDELWPGAIAAQFQSNDSWVINNNKVLEAFENFPFEDGIHSFLVHKFPIPDRDGEPVLVGGVAIDFTERLRAEQKIARLSRIYEFMSGINSTTVRIHDKRELLVEVCRIAVEHGGFKLAWVGLLDKEAGEVPPTVWFGENHVFISGVRTSIRVDTEEGQGIVGTAMRSKKPVIMNDVGNDPRVRRVQKLIDHGFRAVVCLPLLVEGESNGVLALYSAEVGVFDPDEVKLLIDLAGDVSFALEYIDKKERLDYFAYYDPLTGLPNHTLFSNRVNHFLSSGSGQSMAVLMLDVERFAVINDTFGRQTGDHLLKMVGARLRQAAGGGELARISADTFAISLPGAATSTHIARILEDKILAVLRLPFLLDGNELRLSFKCGIAVLPADGSDAETVLKNAEAALKKAKQAGDKYLFYAPQMNASVAETFSLENKLRIAIAKSEFILYYQPKLSLQTNCMVGMEALIRWQSPELGQVQPGKFIPILEETGMILEVGAWALERVAQDYRGWAAKGLQPPRIAVNISSPQMRQKEFLRLIEKALRDGGPGFGLDLEITESVIMENIARYIPKLEAVRNMGVGVAIDDFGTGYSSLSYLARLPVTELKIDRMFIENMVADAHSMTIVSAVISLAHSLKLKVVAEGVETVEQLELLKTLKCGEIQGYWYHRPQPPEKIEELLAAVEIK